MKIEDLTINEEAFLKEIEMPFNQHGVCIFISQDKNVQIDLKFILMEYKNWLVETKILNHNQ